MVFVIAEDNTLSVCEDMESMQGEFEGIDVEDGVYMFFDEKGAALKAEFTVPNQRGRFWVLSGTYTLVPDPENKTSLEDLLTKPQVLERNRYFESIEDIKKFLSRY